MLSDEQAIRLFTFITISFAGALVLVLLMGVLFLVPGRPIGTTGLALGAALAVLSWFGSRAVTAWAADRVATTRRKGGTGASTEAGSASARTVAFIGIGVAEVFGLVGLLAGMAMHDIGPFVVSLPVAVGAVILNASGPGAMRRHLERVRSGRTD